MFIRTVVYLLLAVLLITLIRYVIGAIARSFGQLAGLRDHPAHGGPQAGGELKRDPVCGAYVAAAASVKKTVGGEVLHFCSPECRDKYRG